MLPKTNATVLPGSVLSQFTLSDFQMAEDYFAQRYLAIVAKAAASQPVPVARAQIDSANELIARGYLAYGTEEFDRAAIRPTNLPYLLWLALSKAKPVTLDEAAALITAENDRAVARAVLEMMRWTLPNADPAAGTTSPSPTSPSPSTGPASSGDSAPATSDTTTPAA